MDITYNKADLIRLPIGAYVEIFNNYSNEFSGLGVIEGICYDSLNELIFKVRKTQVAEKEQQISLIHPTNLRSIKE